MATKSIRLSDGTDTLLPESAVSTTFAGSNGTGYTKMADGTLICWGTLQNQTAQSTSVTYPIQFEVGNPTVTYSTGAGGARTPVYVEDVTRTGFTFYRPTTGSGIWLRWIAIGRWKA